MRSRNCGNPKIMYGNKLQINVFVLLLALLITACTSEKTADNISKSTDYGDLITVFGEFSEFRQPGTDEGIPDYSAEAMKAQYAELKNFQERLRAIDPEGWTVSEQIDYHLVRAEMNGLEFHHRVMKPWVKDPCFYLDQMPRMWRLRRLPLDADQIQGMKERFQQVPELFTQAKSNLSNFPEVAGDLAILAIRRIDDMNVSLYK